jgi:hypothetical protein
VGEKGNMGGLSELAGAAGEHAESSREMMTGLAAKATGELAAGMVVGAAGEKLEQRSKRRRKAAEDSTSDEG